MGTKARELIGRSLRILGVSATGETTSAEEAQDALAALNSMLDAWRLDKLLVYAIKSESFPLTAGSTTYSIGPGSTFDTERPVKIESAFLRDSLGTDTPVEVATEQQYDAIRSKASVTGRPDMLVYRATVPSGQVIVSPKPDAGYTLHLRTWSPLWQFSSLDTEVDLPPGYRRLIEYSLAAELSPEYERQITPEAAAIIRSTRAAISRANIRPVLLKNPLVDLLGPTATTDITSGWF